MNTPVHAILAVAALGKKEKPQLNKWAFFGGVLPDLAMFPLFFYEVLRGVSVQTIFELKYFTPLWQNTIDIFNSIPVYVLLLLVAWWRKWDALKIVCLASLLHIVFDLPLHHDDAHRHFLPFSDWRFESPVSYWDPNHYGAVWGVVETVILVAAVYVAYNIVKSKIAKIVLVAVAALTVLLPYLFILFTTFN